MVAHVRTRVRSTNVSVLKVLKTLIVRPILTNASGPVATTVIALMELPTTLANV